MRTGPGGPASSLPTRHRTVRAGARHYQPQTHVDQEPPGPEACGGDHTRAARPAFDTRRCLGVPPKLSIAISGQSTG
jgi:hypothetical protein